VILSITVNEKIFIGLLIHILVNTKSVLFDLNDDGDHETMKY